MDLILRVENLSKSFDGLHLFEKVNLSLQKGTVNSLFGKNGTGKTTFFNIITGFLKPDSGKLWFNEIAIDTDAPYKIAQKGIGKVWQQPRLFSNLSVLDNLIVSKKDHQGDDILNYVFKYKSIRQQEEEIAVEAGKVLHKLEISHLATKISGTLSPGEKKIVNLGMLLMNDAELWILDELFSSINPETIKRISRILLDMKEEGKTIFMIEHKWEYAKTISDHIFEIENKKIILNHEHALVGHSKS